MSDLQRAFAKAKLSTYPANPPIPFDEAEEDENDGFVELPVDDDSSSASSASSASSTGTIIPSSNQNLFARPQGCVTPYTLESDTNITSTGRRIRGLSTRYHGQHISNASSSSNQR